MRLFVIVFSLLAVVIFAFHFQSAVYEAATQPWTELLANISAKLITLFDDGVTADGVQILTDPSTNSQNFAGVRIVAGCNGIEAWLVLVAAIMAFPPYSRFKNRWVVLGVVAFLVIPPYQGFWLYKLLAALAFLFITQLFSQLGKAKLMGIVIGFFAIQALNVVRVISLFYLGQWDKEIFDFAHLYLWQALIILDAFIVFLIWLSRLPLGENKTDSPAPESITPAQS